MNEDRENIKMLFNDILNIIADDYNIIFNNERMALSIVDTLGNNELLFISSRNGTIEVFLNDKSYIFRNIEDTLCFIRERMLIYEFTIFIENVNVSEDKFHAIVEKLDNLKD